MNSINFIDLIDVLSLIIGIQNYQENLTQNDKEEIMKALNQKTGEIVKEVESHLKIQDEKIDKILKILEEKEEKKNGYT